MASLSRARHCAPLPPGTRILSNTCVAPGIKLLAKDRRQVAILRIDEPTEGGYVFDTVIVSPEDAPATIAAAR